MIEWVATPSPCECCGRKPDVLLKSKQTVCEICYEELLIRCEDEKRAREIQALVDGAFAKPALMVRTKAVHSPTGPNRGPVAWVPPQLACGCQELMLSFGLPHLANGATVAVKMQIGLADFSGIGRTFCGCSRIRPREQPQNRWLFPGKPGFNRMRLNQ